MKNQSHLFIDLLVCLMVLLASGTSNPNEIPEDLDRRANLALRQIGHELLLSEGDCNSTLPPVDRGEDGRFILRTGRLLNYDTLQHIAPNIMRISGINQPYSLAFEDCDTGSLVLGFVWSPEGEFAEPTCAEREQLPGCFNLSLAISPIGSGSTSPHPIWFFIVLVLGAFLRVPIQRLIAASQSKEEQANNPRLVSLGSATRFDPNAQVISHAEEIISLTFRESKLLHYFAQHANEVLPREDINAAVWGEEGIIVGRSLDVFVSRLRKKLKADSTLEIVAVHGVGYKFNVG
ncbi:MAG: winged helix-turn-helix domain-containing protein [Bacteroidota bacterium]